MKPLKVARVYRLARKVAALRESSAPFVGPYYWVPTPQGWEVVGYPEEAYGDLIHDSAWRRYTIPYLQDLWRLQDAEVMTLNRVPYGVPRGRVSQALNGVYLINHGGDAPLPGPDAMRAVRKEMNLGGVKVAGKLKAVLDPHEKQLPLHTAVVNRVLEAAKSRRNA